MENNKVIKKSLFYFVGNFSSKVLTSLLVPVYAFYITTKDLGTYDYNQTIINIVIPILFVAIWEAIIRFVLAEDIPDNQRKAIDTSCFFVLSVNALIILITIFVTVFFVIQDIHFIIFMLISASLAQIWQYYSRSLLYNKLYVIASLVGTIVNLLFNIILIYVYSLGIEALYISFIAGQISIFLIIEIKINIIKNITFANVDFYLLKKMLVYSLPLVVNSIAAWLMNGFGRIIIVDNLGAEANGLYSFANKFVTIITTVGSVVSMALLEEAMLSLKNGDFNKAYPKVLETVFGLFQSIILLAIPLICIFYSFISNTDYYNSLYFIPMLFLYSVFLAMSINFGIIFKTIDKNKYQISTTIIGAVVMSIISYLLLEILGIMAVAIGQFAGALTMIISRYYIARKFINFKINWNPIILQTMLFLFVSWISIISGLVFNVVLFFVILIYVIYTNMDVLKGLIKR